MCMHVCACSVMSYSLRASGLQPTRFLWPWSFQARILEWVAISSSRGSSWPRDWTASLSLLHWQVDVLRKLVHPEGFPVCSDSKESTWNAGDLGSIPGLGSSPGEGNGNPLQYSCLASLMDKGAWQGLTHSPWGHEELDTTEQLTHTVHPYNEWRD